MEQLHLASFLTVGRLMGGELTTCHHRIDVVAWGVVSRGGCFDRGNSFPILTPGHQ